MSDAPEDIAAPEEAPAEEDKGSKKRKPAHKPGCLLSMAPVTTPGCAGCLTAVFLITTVATVWITFLLDPDNVPWRHSMSPLRIGVVVLLTLVIPLVVYKMIQWWMEGEASRFPDLDYSWNAGLQALQENGISIASAPLYVILGSNGEQQEKSLLAAAGLRLRVEGVPEGPAPLHWYANADGIYLFCSDACWTSAVAALREELTEEARAKGITLPDAGSQIPNIQPEVTRAAPQSYAGPQSYAPAPQAYAAPQTYASPPPPQQPAAPYAPPPAAPSGPIGGTMMLDASMLAQLAAQQGGVKPGAAPPAPPPAAYSPPAAQTPPSNPGELRGTMMYGADSNFLNAPPSTLSTPSFLMPPPSAPPAPPEPAESVTYSATYERDELSMPVGMEPVIVAAHYAAVSLQQLQYLGGLLRRARAPVCPLNGVLALVQLESIHCTPAEMDEFQKALRSDLATLQYSAQLRAPTTALIVGMEKERGFRELVRRVGKDRAATQRFGRKFDVRAVPTKEELSALSAHVCGAFEDWAYALFREDNSLSRPGNTRLYELLAKVRCGWKLRLAELLAGAFGSEETKLAKDDSLLFSGCYLAATGETPDRQAFAKGVIDKLKEEQELVEWNRDAVAGNRRQMTLANVGMLLTLFLLASLGVMFVLSRLK